MPFTPFHFGPGLFLKSLFQKRFSFSIFVLSQIVMDLETAWNIFRNNDRLHTFFHTYVGAVVVGAITVLITKLYFKIIKREAVSLRIVIVSSLIGTFSHVILDSIMHGDMTPLAPLMNENSVLGAISLYDLHLGCLISGFIGLTILGLQEVKLKNL